MQGFIVNDKATTVDTTVTAINESFALTKKIKLEADTDVDAKAKALPNAGYVSNLELRLKANSGTPETAHVVLTWDSDGVVPFAGPGSGTLYQGLDDSSATYYNTSIALDAWYTSPSTQTTAGTVYMWVRVTASSAATVDFDSARLHWATRETI